MTESKTALPAVPVRVGMNIYQQTAHHTSLSTAIGGDLVVYPALGLANEAGEVLGKLKKLYRDHSGRLTPDAKAALAAELGDCLWYIAELATHLGVDLGAVAVGNLSKLRERQAAGRIQGEGDAR